MSINDHVFTFDIDESFYFEQNQRVESMLNLSIHPDITIQKNEDYLSIRGVLEVMGEYIKDQTEKEVDLREDYTRPYITNIKELGNNYNQFSQLIPVQITVPLYRVKNFEEITAEITQFDYEVSDHEQLFIRAELSIYGIDPSEEREAGQIDLPHVKNEDFELDVKKKEDKLIENEKVEEKEEETVSPKIEERAVESGTKNQEAREEKVLKAAQNDNLLEEQVEVEEGEGESLIKEEAEERSEIKSAATFLSNLFELEDQANYARIRLCIVQEGDSLERIAERFEIPTLQIIQYNGLEDGDLEAGELLYIPNRKKRTN